MYRHVIRRWCICVQILVLLGMMPVCALAQEAAKKPALFTSQDCLQCHADNDPVIDPKILNNSAHQHLTCTDCHSDIKDLPHADHLKQVDCAGCHAKENAQWRLSAHGHSALGVHGVKTAQCQDCHGTHDIHKADDRSSKLYWANIPSTCGKCHQQEFKEYSKGIHGQALAAGSRDTPVCTDCHGEHNNLAVSESGSKVSEANIAKTCGQCHAAERINEKYGLTANVYGSYMQSYHGLAVQQGSVTAANCSSCHGAHEILPSSDPLSTINPKNLKKTCDQCHPGMSSEVARGSVHGSFKIGNNPLNDWVSKFYIILIFLISGILLLHNILDFSIKAVAHYRHSLAHGKDVMGLNERWQHFILVITFMMLAYTGFSLKFPQTWWSFMFFGHGQWLRLGHRGAGLVFCALALYHIYYLLFTRKGRWQLGALSIKKIDLEQFIQSFQYYFGLIKNKPKVGIYSYVQKLEYWALLWGSSIMVITGALMFSESWFLGLFPKWLYDVVRTVHAYEAILACVTIIIWHGYFAIFDPDVYPGNWSWVHGRHAKKSH